VAPAAPAAPVATTTAGSLTTKAAATGIDLLLAYPEGKPLTAGGPPFYPQRLAKDKGVQIRFKYHVTKLPLWSKAVYGGTFIGGSAAISREPETMDYLKLVSLSYVTRGGVLMFLNMGRCDMVGREDYSRCPGAYHSNDGAIIPGMLTKWEQPDPTTYVLTLRKGILWPNIPPVARTDREVTADDVVWWLQTVKKEGALKDQFALVSSIEAADRYTVRIKMQQPHYEMLRNLAHHSLAIFPKECYDAQASCKGKLISPGPFILTEYVSRQREIYEKNPEFYLKGLPYVDRLFNLFIADFAAEKAAFITGKIDTLRTEIDSETTSVANQVPGATANSIHLAAMGNMLRPQLEGPLADVRVRRAMALTMDHRALWETMLEGHTFFPALVSRWEFGADFFMTPEQASEWYQFNPEKAKQLLKEAGFPNGFQLELTHSEAGTAYVNGMLFLQAQWKKYLNIDVSIKRIDSASYTNLQRVDRNWKGLLWERCGNLSCYPESELVIGQFTKGHQLNLTKVDDPVISEVFVKQRTEFDPAKRAALLWQFQEREADQIYVFRVAMNTAIHMMQPWELNGIPSTQGFLQVINAPSWLAMHDVAREPKNR
jgi:peptide/nickel transport system substrate-binding protein